MKKLLFMFVCAAFITACSSSPVDKLEKFVEKTEKNYKDFSASDWIDNAKELEEIGEEIDEADLSKEEEKRCLKLAERYQKIAVKGSADMLEDLGGIFN